MSWNWKKGYGAESVEVENEVVENVLIRIAYESPASQLNTSRREKCL